MYSEANNYGAEFIEFLRQHVPTESLPPAVPTAIVTLLFGVAICLLGALLVRWFLAIAFAAGGLTAGLEVSRRTALAPAPTALAGGLIGGAIGYFFYRIWVGLFAAAFLASAVATIYSSQSVVPKFVDFQRAQEKAATSGQFTVPEAPDGSEAPPATTPTSPAVPQTLVDRSSVRAYLDQFEAYLDEHAPWVPRNVGLLTLAAGLIGLVMGLFLARPTLIVFTSAFGTVLVMGGLGTLAEAMGMTVENVYQQSPGITSIAALLCFSLSIVLQTLMTRKRRLRASAPAPAA